jgi:hypothetical protein
MSKNVQFATEVPEEKQKVAVFNAYKSETPQSTHYPGDRNQYLQRSIGNEVMQRLMTSETIQTKLTISQPNDFCEQEADRVADEVMRMPELNVKTKSNQVSMENMRDENEGSIKLNPFSIKSIAQRQEIEEKEGKNIRMKMDSAQPSVVSNHFEQSFHNARNNGQPLDSATRTFFEPRFGVGFGDVRVHTNEESSNTASAINAQAYTIGKNIMFDTGRYAPATSEGRRLIAHELVHVVQNRTTANQTANPILRRTVEEDASRIESLLSYGVFDWAITEAEAIEALEILDNLPSNMQAAVLRRIDIGRLREHLPSTHTPILDTIITQAGGQPTADVSSIVTRVQDLLSYGVFDWAITDAEATEAFNLLLSLAPEEQRRVVLVINYQRLYDNLPDVSQKTQLQAIRAPAVVQETTDLTEMEGYRNRARTIIEQIRLNASRLTIPTPPASGRFETWLSNNYLNNYCSSPSRRTANEAIARITEDGGGGFSHYGYGLLRGMADRANSAGISFIDSPYLLGTPAPHVTGAGGELWDPWSQGPNLTQLMHFAAGMKWSWAPAFIVQWYFIRYERTSQEGWQIFGLDSLNDVIAEEGSRLFAEDLKNAAVTCPGGVVDLDPYFIQGRNFLRTQLSQADLNRLALRVHQPIMVVAVDPTGRVVNSRNLWNMTIMEQIMTGASDADILATPDARILTLLYHLLGQG